MLYSSFILILHHGGSLSTTILVSKAPSHLQVVRPLTCTLPFTHRTLPVSLPVRTTSFQSSVSVLLRFIRPCNPVVHPSYLYRPHFPCSRFHLPEPTLRILQSQDIRVRRWPLTFGSILLKWVSCYVYYFGNWLVPLITSPGSLSVTIGLNSVIDVLTLSCRTFLSFVRISRPGVIVCTINVSISFVTLLHFQMSYQDHSSMSISCRLSSLSFFLSLLSPLLVQLSLISNLQYSMLLLQFLRFSVSVVLDFVFC